MRITKRQLRRIIREENKGSTEKYDDDSALRGDQDELPDALQKGIIDKTIEDREADESEKKNESRMKITKRHLRKIIREEQLRALNESSPSPMKSLAHPHFAKIIKGRLNETLQSAEEKLFLALDEYVMILDEDMGYDVPAMQLKGEVLNFVNGYFEQT
jgi:hypothetical protein